MKSCAHLVRELLKDLRDQINEEEIAGHFPRDLLIRVENALEECPCAECRRNSRMSMCAPEMTNLVMPEPLKSIQNILMKKLEGEKEDYLAALAPDKVEEEDYLAAVRDMLGWCTNCGAFTREGTEPDAEEYDCPDCGKNTVYGAEEALIHNLFNFEPSNES